MALPNKTMAGFSAALYAQSGATPTALTLAQLSTLGNVSGIAISGNKLIGGADPRRNGYVATNSFQK